ncbi:hypothetical protein [Flammeovirga aprica]|uniref:Glycerophosphoryl diester phosphodiesterase membrane domain-containing protein n=1 Tax=Flammeovirga aprica JL-4 TaxID=694437 RepID=A0A7X9XBM4_9BACT|nr:hypothetical protein [Flammeovirga aprica]NME70872.1 hypothetical protein [Flammeovirga aprica JL-4]
MACPFFLVGTALMTYSFVDPLFDSSSLGSSEKLISYIITVMLSPALWVGGLIIHVGFLMLITMGPSIVKAYMDKKENFTISDVRKITFEYLPKVFVISILLGILIIISSFFFYLPGIYVMITYSIAIPIIVFEDLDIMGTMKRCSYLIKHNWWSSFGYIFMTMMIVSLINQIIGFGLTAVSFIVPLLYIGESIVQIYMIVLISCSCLTLMITPLVVIIMQLGFTVLYFSLKEKKELTSLVREVELMA